jgi:CheY-like chemotaxis protein
MTFPDSKEMLTILLAEDDDGHAELVLGSLREAGVKNPMQRFRDGQELLNYLQEAMVLGALEISRPYVLLLDIRMPRMDGLEVLRRVKADPVLRTLPVIMLTTTDDPREVEECYRLGCNGYVVKPVGYESFSETLHRLGLFLSVLRVARTPLAGGRA